MTALVLLHGFTGHPSSWDRLVARLPDGTRVLRPMLLGHGAPAHGARFEDEVDRLAGVVHAASFEGARVVGYSMGARLALSMLVRHPRLFTSAVLIGAHPGIASETDRAARIAADEEWASLAERDGIERFVEAWELLPIFATQASLPPAVRDAHRARRLSHDPAGLARALRTLGLGRMPSHRDALSGVRVPVWLVCGEHDEKFVSIARQMLARLPRGELRLVPGAGHDPTIEDPAACARAIRDRIQTRHHQPRGMER